MSLLVSHSSEHLGRLHDDSARIVADPAVLEAARSIRERRGLGHDMLGWLDLPSRRDDLPRLTDTAARLREEIDTLVVIGIGGSYLGARAVLEATAWRRTDDPGPRVFFAGHHLEAHELGALLRALEGREVAVNVISKSGTTTEPAIAFRLLRKYLEDTYGPEKAARRIVATTDADRGALRTLAEQKDYTTFAVPDDVGGRFSVLSPVGLVPLAVAGCDVEALLDGAGAELVRCLEGDATDVPAVRYAALRHAAYLQGTAIEVLASFFPSLHQVSEWWKQLFGESEGKQGRGLFPASVDYTTDLHSMGQYLQDGRRLLLETFLDVADPPAGPVIPSDSDDLDGLEYLAGRGVAEVNREALPAVAEAHASGGVPSQVVTLPDLGESSLGSLLAFFEFSVAVSGRLLGVHPFDQPGVEAYKTNLFRRLGKPGFAD
ncbi:MAG TPA: glucose-6-phosphate isomerase [Candidatus Krumholzibacteria bacterium]|nr:glucose-6-phosphate isomerase [Candidatus Krumholzibacteria bacterium]